MQNLQSWLQFAGPLLCEGRRAVRVADRWRLARAPGKPLRWRIRPVSVHSGHIERGRWGQNMVTQRLPFLFFKDYTTNVTHWRNVRPLAPYRPGWCPTLVPCQPRCHLGVTTSQQEGCSSSGHHVEGRAPLWYCRDGSCSSLRSIENTRTHSCSGHPSGSEAKSAGGGGPGVGRSPHDRFHLFTGGLSVTGWSQPRQTRRSNSF